MKKGWGIRDIKLPFDKVSSQEIKESKVLINTREEIIDVYKKSGIELTDFQLESILKKYDA